MKRYCSRCKKEFEENNTFRMCEKCRESNRRYQKELKERNSAKPKKIDISNLGQKIQAAKKRGRQNKVSDDPLVLLEREIIEYNSAHGTRYSYGQYMTRKERGWL